MTGRYRRSSVDLPKLILGVSLLACSQVGCVCEFHAYKGFEDEDGSYHIPDPSPIDLPLFASENIEVYWEEGWARDRKEGLPDRSYEVIGSVYGVIALVWQSRWVLEQNFRRGAAALNGDAVIRARGGVFFGAFPASEYYGRVVRWTDQAQSKASTADEDSG